MVVIDDKKLAKVATSFQIPVKPQILTDLQRLLDTAEPDIDEIAVLISNDVGLSSSILKLVNSPFYGMKRKSSKIKQAVMMLGLETISGLMSALLLKSAFKGTSSISLERFWDDSLDVANAMAFVAQRVKNKISVDILYTIGLFQNCGIPLLAQKFDDYKDILIEANSSGVNSIQLEEENYQTNHAVLGYYVASSWHLPKEICELILRHHEIAFLSKISGNKEQLAFATLKVADNLVERVKRRCDSPDWIQSQRDALNVLGLSISDYEDLKDEYVELFE